ncbi:hypothetical protein ACI78V_02005 [Geodermatophilus sp. SYSU D00742]
MTEDDFDPLAPPPLPPLPSAAPTRRRPRRSQPASPTTAVATAGPASAAPVADAWAVLTRLRPLAEVVAALGACAAAQHSLAESVTTYRLADGPVLVDPAEVLAALATPPASRAA